MQIRIQNSEYRIELAPELCLMGRYSKRIGKSADRTQSTEFRSQRKSHF